MREFGGAEGDRTPDLKTASLARSQLRHSPNWMHVPVCQVEKPHSGISTGLRKDRTEGF